MDLFLLSSQDINWWTGVVWITCGLLWCFYQLDSHSDGTHSLQRIQWWAKGKDVTQSMVTHTLNLCSAFNPSKCAHTAVSSEQDVSPQSWYWGWRERWTFTPCLQSLPDLRPLGYKSDSLSIRPRLPHLMHCDAMLHFSKSDEETNSSTSWMTWKWANFHFWVNYSFNVCLCDSLCFILCVVNIWLFLSLSLSAAVCEWVALTQASLKATSLTAEPRMSRTGLLFCQSHLFCCVEPQCLITTAKRHRHDMALSFREWFWTRPWASSTSCSALLLATWHRSGFDHVRLCLMLPTVI